MGVIAGSALSRAASTARAIAEAATRALSRASLQRAPLAICFATEEHFKSPDLVPGIRSATGATSIIGCTGTGVFATDGLTESGPGLALLVADGLSVRVSAAQALKHDSAAAFSALEPALSSRGGGCALVLANPGGGFEARMMSGFDSAGIPVVGGGASGRSGASLMALDELFDGGIAIARLTGVEAVAGIAASAQPFGRAFTITSAKGNHIYTLDQRPALELLREAADEAGLELGKAGAFLFAGVSLDPAGKKLDRRHRLVRPLVGADPMTGALAIGERVREGQAFTFCLREAVGAREELKEMLVDQQERLAGKTPSLGIYIDCAGRGSSLYGSEGFDLTLLLRHFPDLPLIGFQSSFELGPLGGRTRLHLYTGALLLLA